jgi:diguanylate cyclase (GGDEF)-like protein/PAS domain S-box-containing protein
LLTNQFVLDHLGEGLVLQDGSGAVVDCNSVATDLLGVSREQLMGATSFDAEWRNVRRDGTLFVAEDHPAVVARRTGAPCTDVIMGVDPPGRPRRWLVVDAHPIVERGRVTQVLVSFKDAARRMERDRKLAESEAQFRFVVEHSSDVVLLVGPDNQYQWVSPAVRHVLGWEPEDLLGRTMFDFVVEVDVQRILDARQQGSDGLSAVDEFRFRCADGSRRWVSARSQEVAGPSGEPLAVVMSLRDVEEQVHERQQRADSERQLTAVLTTTSTVVSLWSLDRRMTYSNQTAALAEGVAVETILGLTGEEMGYSADDLRKWNAAFDEVVATGESTNYEVCLPSPDGPRWFSFEVTPEVDPGGNVVSVTSYMTDVSELHWATEALAESELRFRLLAENASDLVFRISADSTIEWVSPSSEALLGWRPDEMEGHPSEQFVHPDDVGTRWRAMDAIQHAGVAKYEARIKRKDGSTVWLAVSVRAIVDDEGQQVGAVGSARDVQREVEIRDALAQRERLYRTTVDAAPIGMALIDLDRRFVEVNPALCKMLGRSADWLKSHGVVDVIDPTDDLSDREARTKLLSGETDLLEMEKRLVRADATTIWVQHSVALIRSAGRPARFVSQYVDITEARSDREALVGMAARDPLTGLANRTRVLEEIGRAQASGRRTGASTAVLMLDLDQFKNVNDSLGHAVGDELLRRAGDRILESTRASDLAARLGGDEFVVVMRDLANPAEGERAAWRLVQKFRQPLMVGELELYTTASVGVAISNSGDAGDLLREADTAMYVAKNGGRDRVAVFNEDLRVAATRRLDLEGHLRKALAKGELMVWYQPEVDLRDGSLTAVEALLRWRRPDGEVWTADRFVDVAEETGLILDVGDWVILQAFGQAAAWADERPGEQIDVRFNVSALQLAESGLAAAIDDALDTTGADPTHLCAEITETALLRRTSAVMDNLAMLRERGIRLAIDDFGTGYASLAYLRDYPADVVKIDRSFVTDLTDDVFDRRLVGGVIALAQRLGMTTTAEGVEHQVQADILREMGCDGAQGFLYSKAVPPETITELRRHKVVPTTA